MEEKHEEKNWKKRKDTQKRSYAIPDMLLHSLTHVACLCSNLNYPLNASLPVPLNKDRAQGNSSGQIIRNIWRSGNRKN